jgi:fucose 4-O-acetylase-like acetyltransferase
VVTFLLALVGIKLGYAIPAFGSWDEVKATAYGFFVQAFTDGHQYHLHAAAWFILQLWLVHVVFQVVCFRPGRWVPVLALAATVPVTVFLLEQGLQSYEDLRLTGVRTALAFFFFLTGHLVRLFEDRLRKVLLAPWFLLVLFVAVNVVAVNFGNIRYNFVLGNVNNERVWVPMLASVLIVLMVFQLAHHVARFLDDRSLVFVVGRSTMDILIWHFTVFFLVNVALWALGVIPFERLSDNWYVFEKERLWLLYEVPAIALPVLMRRWYERWAAPAVAKPPVKAEPVRQREARR